MLKIKEWKADDMMHKVCGYGDKWMEFNEVRSEDRTPQVDKEGYITFMNRFEIVKETAKAIFVEFDNGWKEWLPKSAVQF